MKDDTTKTIIKVLVLAGAALGIYWWLKQSGYWAQWFGGAIAPGTQPTVQPPATVTAPAATPPPPAAAPGLPGPYAQAAIAMQSGAAAALQDFDQWSYWWQNNPTGYGQAGSISPNMIDAMIQQGGGDRSVNITALQWVTLLWQQQQTGLSGLAAPLAQQYAWVN
jgi:hypothetical protein